MKEEHREKVQEALDAYNELTAEQKELVAAKNQQKLFDCCAALDISVDGGDIDLEALELQQEEASRQAAIIEQFVLAEDEDDASSKRTLTSLSTNKPVCPNIPKKLSPGFRRGLISRSRQNCRNYA